MQYSLNVALMLAFLSAGCSKDEPPKAPSTKAKSSINNLEQNATTSEIIGGGADDPNSPPTEKPTETDALKLAAFGETVHPILITNCAASCHNKAQAPVFAVPDQVAALTATDGKIDFADPLKSALVVRLSSLKHQCWTECDADAKEMTKAIEAFKAKLVEGGLYQEVVIKQSAQVGFASAISGPGEPVAGTYVQFAKDSPTIVAPMVVASAPAEVDAAGGVSSYLETTPNANAAASFSFNVTKAGTYALWIRAKVPMFNANAAPTLTYSVSVNNGAPQNWVVETLGNANSWVWDRSNTTINNAATGQVIQATAGQAITVRVNGTAGSTVPLRFNRIALTEVLTNFQGGEVVGTAKSLTIPIKDLCGGKDVSLKVEVNEFDAANKVYTVRNLRMINSAAVNIKNIDVLINGKLNTLNTTFKVVNETVQPPGKLLVSQSLQAVGDQGFASDKISFAVEKCE